MQQHRDDALKKKRYGQYFSGKKVANLLVSLLPDNLQIQSIIDPMAGSGDLLLSAQNKYPQAENIVGIDIDAGVLNLCKAKIPNAKISIEDAFRSNIVKESSGWDLVITNPPYIRYQTLKTNREIGLPDGDELRHCLLECIKASSILDKDEKKLYLEIARGYSGLSDMAVPAWILCASMVKLGGYLAMVVPENWLNRDYAVPIHYLLLRCYEIIVVAKDTGAVWFDNAEVRTCLVIARRKRNENLHNSYKETVFLELTSDLVGNDSLIDNLFYKGWKKYDALACIIGTRADIAGNGFSARTTSSRSLFPGLMSELTTRKWVRKEDQLDIKGRERLPKEIRRLVGDFDNIEYRLLEDYGWGVGQGMRTGANDFFYATILSETEKKTLLQTNSWYGECISVDTINVRRSLKKRSEVKGLSIEYKDLTKCILYIQTQVRKEDYKNVSPGAVNKYEVMGTELCEYISAAENYVSQNHKKPFCELSAVKPNEKIASDGFTRFWYMLPPFKERHIPNLCIPRICGDRAEAIYIRQSADTEIVTDANFITLWNPDFSSQMKMYALLNSTWTKTYLEVVGTVMGGGALKIEASHLRRILFPDMKPEKEKALEILGRKLLNEGNMSANIQNQIDEIVSSSFDSAYQKELNHSLKDLLFKKISERTGRKNDR